MTGNKGGMWPDMNVEERKMPERVDNQLPMKEPPKFQSHLYSILASVLLSVVILTAITARVLQSAPESFAELRERVNRLESEKVNESAKVQELEGHVDLLLKGGTQQSEILRDIIRRVKMLERKDLN